MLNWIKQRWNLLLIQGYQFKTGFFSRVKLSQSEDTDIEIYFISVQ